MNEKKEYIELNALIDSFENCYYLYNSTDREIVRQALENAPIADVAPVVHGEWMVTVKPIGDSVARRFINTCSVCGSKVEFLYREHSYEYCPHCGAKMDGGGE